MSTSTRAPSGRSSGFTLIEVMLAVAVAAMMFATVFMSLDQVIRTRQALSNHSTPYVMGPAILDVIANDLANVCFYDLKDNNSFYATNADLSGRPADAISFITASRTYQPEIYNGDEDRRHSYLNEVAYLLKRGPGQTPFLELWRREDFFVDDRPHAEGDFVLLYDKVFSLDLWFVARDPMSAEGVAGSREKDAEQMLQEGWNSIEEAGLPRAVQIVLTIFAQDSDASVMERLGEGDARLYTFKRYVTLPQVHMSLESEEQIANWDGTLQEATTNVVGGNRPGAAGQGGEAQAVGGAAGRAGAQGQRGQRGRPSSGPGATNPFLQALQGRGNRPSGNASAGSITQFFNQAGGRK
jgi:prepilin-type N-terminal cleavage/methylation domain-containing protein